MQRTCVRCGKPFEAQRATAKYCGSSCRAMQSADGVASVSPIAEASQGLLEDDPIVVQVVRELTASGRLETAKGQYALAAARRLAGSKYDGGTSYAALLRECRSCLDDALEGAAVSDDPMDELRLRRDAKRSG